MFLFYLKRKLLALGEELAIRQMLSV